MNLDYSNPLIKAIGDKWGLELELEVTESRRGKGEGSPLGLLELQAWPRRGGMVREQLALAGRGSGLLGACRCSL